MLRQAKIETVLAVPVFSGRSSTPAFIFCCYSFVRSGSIPFVLKFVQQALKLLWGGLDNVQPHESVGEGVWKDVAPADLGEMAADVEMHQHFMIKKRPIGAISTDMDSRDESIRSLTVQVESLESVSGASTVPSIYTGHGGIEESSPQLVQRQTYEGIQNQLHDAIKSVADMKPVHHHIATTDNGSKRAHVYFQEPHTTYTQQQQPLQQELQHQTFEKHSLGSVHGIMPAVSTPLPLPHPFPLPNQVVHPVNNERSSSCSQETQIPYQSLHQQTQSNLIYNSPQNPLVDNNVNTSNTLEERYHENASSYSFSSIQQPHQQEQEPMPNQVYSLPMDKLNATGIIVSAPSAPFTPHNTPAEVIGMGHTLSPNTTTPPVSPVQSATNVMHTKTLKVRVFLNLCDLYKLIIIFCLSKDNIAYPTFS